MYQQGQVSGRASQRRRTRMQCDHDFHEECLDSQLHRFLASRYSTHEGIKAGYKDRFWGAIASARKRNVIAGKLFSPPCHDVKASPTDRVIAPLLSVKK